MNSKTKICPYCKELIARKKHLIKCNPDVHIDVSYQLMIELTFDCNVNEVINDYVNGLSLPDIKKKYSIPYDITIALLKIKNLKTRTIIESSNENKLNKYKKTVYEKYGVDNVSKLENIKNKKKDTFIKNYGVDNIFKTDGFTEYVNITMMEKYGKLRNTNPQMISDIRKKFSKEKWKIIQERYSDDDIKWKFISSLELKIENVLNQNSISYKSQKFINGLSYDFHIINTNIIIEINGDYWHANPLFYEENDNINYVGKKNCIVSEIWKRDLDKKINAINYGYVVIYIWEYDINYHIKNNTLNEYVLNLLIKKDNE